MPELLHISIGAVLLSIVHASIPNHWLPLVALAKSENWTERLTMGITALSGFSHIISTIIIGILVGILGYNLSNSYTLITQAIAPTVLILLGMIYIILNIRHNLNHHEHSNIKEINKRTTSAIILSLTISMFFSPCLEIEAYYLFASKLGWTGIASVSLIYTLVTVAGMMLLVYLGTIGIKKINSHFLEHNDKLITGLLLIAIGISGYFIK